MHTLAAVLSRVKEPLSIEKLAIPELKPGQVLVKLAYSGICHSQLNEISGLKGQDKFLPHLLGHEGSGIVEGVGSAVKKVKPLDRVVLTWIKGSGADVASCVYKRDDGSIVNSGAICTFATRAVISENRLVKIPDNMPLREAALLGCAIPTGAGIIINSAKLTKANSIAIFGLGGIGLSALLAAKMKQAAIIIAVDILDSKLELALKLGATHAINAQKEDVLSKISEITGKRGTDYAVECAGVQESMEAAFKSVCDKGGLCIIAGNLALGKNISIDPFDLIKGKRITGTWGGESSVDKDIIFYADEFMEGRLKIDLLIGAEGSLDQINDLIESIEKGQLGRILINFEKT